MHNGSGPAQGEGDPAALGEGQDEAAPPGEVGPHRAMPDGAIPDAALPDAALPDGAMPDGALPDGAGPGLRASLEAIMLVADEPVSEVVIAQVLERPRAEVAGALRELADSYDSEERGFELREVAGGWRFYTREECAPVVERFVSDGQEVRCFTEGW